MHMDYEQWLRRLIHIHYVIFPVLSSSRSQECHKRR